MPAAAMAQSGAGVRPQVDTGTTFAILVSLSVCHMLNDLNQSLVPALYPILKSSYQPGFRANRPDHARIPAHRIDVATGGWAGDGPASAAILLARRHELQSDRTAAAVGGQFLSADPVRGGSGRDRLIGVPSRGVTRRPHGIRRPLRLRAVVVSVGRIVRLGDRTTAGGVHRAAARPGQRRMVLPASRCWRWQC